MRPMSAFAAPPARSQTRAANYSPYLVSLSHAPMTQIDFANTWQSLTCPGTISQSRTRLFDQENLRLNELKTYFRENACRRSAESLGRELYNLPFEPYAPVRQQLLNLLRLI